MLFGRTQFALGLQILERLRYVAPRLRRIDNRIDQPPSGCDVRIGESLAVQGNHLVPLRFLILRLGNFFPEDDLRRTFRSNMARLKVPRELAELWARMCPAHVYEVGEADGDGTVEVKLAPSNCVQCGAITAKGGRLTPPEGGSGPEYTLT